MASPPGFREVGNNVAIYEPAEAELNVPSPAQPALIILCAWTGAAKASQFARYTTPYQKHHPQAHILLVRTVLSDFPRFSDAAFNEYLRPARKAILSILGSKPKWQQSKQQPAILLHILSHGGLRMALQLVRAVQYIDLEGTPLPIKLMVLECCPGDSSASNIYQAAKVTFTKRQPARLLQSSAMRGVVGAVSMLQSCGVLTSIDDMRAQLNDPAVFGHGTVRLYLYSLADPMMPWRHVEAHREEALVKGFRADQTVFDKAHHMGLMRENAMRYWEAVTNAWRSSFPHDDLAIRAEVKSHKVILQGAAMSRSRL
jgi:hypothetical protein